MKTNNQKQNEQSKTKKIESKNQNKNLVNCDNIESLLRAATPIAIAITIT